MRSDPGRVMARAVAGGGCTFPASRAICSCVGAGTAAEDATASGRSVGTPTGPRWASDISTFVTSAAATAAAPAAAPFKNPRRFTGPCLDLDILILPGTVSSHSIAALYTRSWPRHLYCLHLYTGRPADRDRAAAPYRPDCS